MLSDVSNQLTQVIEKRQYKNKIEQDLHQVEQRLVEKTGMLTMLERQLKQEQVDVEKLERLSLTGLFYSVLGSREQQVEKERQEALAAQLKYQQAKRGVEMLRADQQYLAEQLRGLRDVEDEYAALLAQKENLLRQTNAKTADELMNLAEQIANRNVERREITEAITAARGVLDSLDQVIASLQSAEGWGTWDMLGGGMLSTAIKHSRIDDARDAVQDVQAKMNHFTRELADVQRSMELTIDIGNLDIFADFFFDGLISDWIVQSKIQKSLEQSRLAKNHMLKAVEDLEKLSREVEGQVLRLQAQRTALIENA